jgi:hypothetical protein
MFTRLLAGTLVLGLGLLGGGCSSRMGPEGTVSGKVTYQGKPLPGGQVTFLTSKGLMFSGPIDPEGNYKVKAVAGEARIAVDNLMLKSKQPSAAELRSQMGIKPPPGAKVEEVKSSTPAITGTYVPLPEKYRSAEKSGLSYTVKSGSQSHDIELPGNP